MLSRSVCARPAWCDRRGARASGPGRCHGQAIPGGPALRGAASGAPRRSRLPRPRSLPGRVPGHGREYDPRHARFGCAAATASALPVAAGRGRDRSGARRNGDAATELPRAHELMLLDAPEVAHGRNDVPVAEAEVAVGTESDRGLPRCTMPSADRVDGCANLGRDVDPEMERALDVLEMRGSLK